jgi:CRISPR-associated protein Csx17
MPPSLSIKPSWIDVTPEEISACQTMTTSPSIKLQVISLSGLHLDTLGHYFAALGLLRLAARQWTSVKGCWRDGVFHLVGGPKDFSEFANFLIDVGKNNKWTQYTQGWSESQKKDTKEKGAINLALWRTNQASEIEAVFVLSHIATTRRLSFNPVFGTGGNAGIRNFSKGWKKAQTAISNPAAQTDLFAFLQGKSCSLLADYNAACWFSDANKKYNFSPDKPFCKGQITPWAMLLACEAFPLLAGAVSRQLGSRREGTGAFPFVTAGTAPENEKEVETLTGEFWAPVWNKPLSVAEVSALYQRGRAEVDGRGAITSAAFATAIIQRGTDAGLTEFRRFSLLHTTSAQTFESRLASVHPLAVENDISQAIAVSNIIRFRDALPPDGKRFSGLQGPIDTALVRLSASGNNDDLLRENSWALLDAVFASLKKTANNKTHREREPALELLPVSWAVSLLQKEREFTPEMRIALALASLRADAKKTALFDETTAPFIAYRVGVVPAWKNNWSRVKIAGDTPLRVEWSERPLEKNLIAIIRRRLAVETEAQRQPPFNTRFTLPIADVFTFLNNETDDATITRWLDRFLLFDWSFLQTIERDTLSTLLGSAQPDAENRIHATESVFCLLRPLFHTYTFTQIQPEPKSGNAPTAGMLRPLIALLECGDMTAVFSAAQSRYKSLLIGTADFGKTDVALANPRRLLAALLLSASPASVAKHFSRWQLPARNKP